MSARRATWLVIPVILLAACASPTTPAESTTTVVPPETLRLAFTGGFGSEQIGVFEERLLADGVLDLAISDEFDTDVLGVEQEIIRAVAAGDLDLGWVGARAFSELSVTAFDPLIAPFAIDSLATERAVLESDLPARMLDAVEQLGVEGLAVVGGPLRRPIAADSPMTSTKDFASVPFYSFHGATNALSIAALGAVNVDAAPPVRDEGIEDGSIRAYENTLTYLSGAADRRARIMTVNVNLWPSIGVLIANPGVMDRLSTDQADVLRAAASDAAELWFTAIGPEADLAAQVCAAGGRLAVASEADLQGLRDAVAPVFAAIAGNPVDAASVRTIAEIRGDTPPDSLAIPDGCAAQPLTSQ
jgi:TRAP-type C4-dicarboxylate transport system substrate-binding protein